MATTQPVAAVAVAAAAGGLSTGTASSKTLPMRACVEGLAGQQATVAKVSVGQTGHGEPVRKCRRHDGVA